MKLQKSKSGLLHFGWILFPGPVMTSFAWILGQGTFEFSAREILNVWGGNQSGRFSIWWFLDVLLSSSYDDVFDTLGSQLLAMIMMLRLMMVMMMMIMMVMMVVMMVVMSLIHWRRWQPGRKRRRRGGSNHWGRSWRAGKECFEYFHSCSFSKFEFLKFW